jgi:hypothetical protein
LERYEQFLGRHPRIALGAALSGSLFTFVGLAGVPSDLENWSAAFQAIGSELGRWLLVVVGLGVIAAVAISKRTLVQGHPPRAPAGQRNLREKAPTPLPTQVRRPPQDPTQRQPASSGRIYGSGAIQQAIFENARREDRAAVEREFVTMIEEGKKLCEGEFVGDPPWLHYGHWRRGILDFVGSVLGAAERQRFLEVEPAGSTPRDHIVPVMNWLRERRDNPESWTPELWGDDLAAAISKRYETQGDADSTGNATPHQPSESLAIRLDSMMREGMGLVTEFSAPVQPEQKNGVWKVSGGDVPKEWWDQAATFQQRIRDLLQAEHPALLTDFRDGCNSHLQKEREARERRKQDPSPDKRSDPEKVLALANYERSGPRREVEAFLEGLAAARKSI